MSKQSEAKSMQGYRDEPHNCGNCEHRRCEMRVPAWMRDRVANGTYSQAYVDRYAVEAGHKCAIGEFAVKKTATCQRWSRGPSTQN